MIERMCKALLVGVPAALLALTACSPGKPADDPKAVADKDASKRTVQKGITWTTTNARPYELKRHVYRVEITRIPLTRTRCWIGRREAVAASTKEKTLPPDIATIEWDPSSAAPPVRRVTLREEAPDVWCSAESGQFAKNGDARPITYMFDRPPSCVGPHGNTTCLSGTVRSLGEPTAGNNPPASPPPQPKGPPAQPKGPPAQPPAPSSPPPKTGCTAGELDVCVTVTEEPTTNPALGGVDAQFSMNRSLDPLTPLATELLSVIAEVAVDRAKAGAAQAVKDELKATVCDIHYVRGTDSRVSFLSKEQKEALKKQEEEARKLKEEAALKSKEAAQAAKPKGAEVAKPKEPEAATTKEPEASQETKVQLFSRVCEALESVRIEELASTSKILARALAGDLTDYGFDVFSPKFPKEPGLALLGALKRVVLGLIESRSVGTERDFQTMLLRLGRTPIPVTEFLLPASPLEPGAKPPVAAPAAGPAGKQATKLDQREWSCAVGIGFAVLRECLHRDSCSAEQLQSALDSELHDPGPQCVGTETGIRSKWPELGSMLARTVDVFRPPPGVAPNQTAKTATNVLIDALVKLEPLADLGTDKEKELLDRVDIEKIRTLINAVFDKEYVAGILAASGLVVEGLKTCEDNNDDSKSCTTNATPVRVRKGIALLNGFVSYASTYKEGVREGEESKSDAEREKLRHDERKKAMESLIDSTTDRANRGGQWVWSVGVGVGMSGGRVGNLNKLDGDYFFVPSLSLPLGAAVQHLPGGGGRSDPLGFHAQLSVLDAGQYVTLNKNGKRLPDAELGTAAVFAGQLGMLVGRPTFSGLVGVDFGYAPALKFSDNDKVGFWRFGVFAGTYIPFFDLN